MLTTLKKIFDLVFDNIIQHPRDDRYRQIKLSNKRFSSEVWRCPAAMNMMKMSGWEEDGDSGHCVRLRGESGAKAISELLEKELQKLRKSTRKAPMLHGSVSIDACSSSKCCSLTQDTARPIVKAIEAGCGRLLKELLSSYHATCVKSMRVVESVSIIEFVFMTRQIGIARILASEYGVDFNGLNQKGDLHYFYLFDGCDSSESCQSLVIQFIKELNIDVHRQSYIGALHIVVLHKLFTVVKFLVEECKVDVNYVSSLANDGTPLHIAYGMGEESIVQYLIEHGADQNALDSDGRKPIDYKLYADPRNVHARTSQYYIKRQVIKKDIFGKEHVYFKKLCNEQEIDEFEAVELTFQEFPSLQETLDGGIAKAIPILNKLSHYITEMAPSYYEIGLELDIPNATLKLIRNDPNLSDLKEKCRKMLEVWLKNDTSATWKKLCEALQKVGMSVLAEQIKNSC